ncbi:hypothetical protein Sme01_07310 [Sphaerisporangium melleum]|uniref:Uncharacterized protein n=1 Tax=Sphaerisporangium melleum TaxID=321316 RepID=A0A917VFL1_9ACTN|nr:hypothetical protein GCM10007964_14890 [Sphaerisporangium melleum]GII68255.1 hypothetical protein Sme01_07310 [Sphaerisporangium melleum]
MPQVVKDQVGAAVGGAPPRLMRGGFRGAGDSFKPGAMDVPFMVLHQIGGAGRDDVPT